MKFDQFKEDNLDFPVEAYLEEVSLRCRRRCQDSSDKGKEVVTGNEEEDIGDGTH